MSRRKSIDLAARRNFLRGMAGAAGLGVVRSFFPAVAADMLVRGIFNTTQAAALGVNPKAYLNINMGGGFPAHFLYMPLAPYGTARNPNDSTTSDIILNVGQANYWAAGQPVYRMMTASAGGETVRLPSQWNINVPTTASATSTTAMTSMLQNTMFFRGFQGPVDGHGTNAVAAMRPNSSAPSMTGMAADYSTRPVPAVQLRTDSDFFSAQRASVKVINHSNFPAPSYVVASPFLASAQMKSMLDKKDALGSLFTDAVNAVRADAKKKGADQVEFSIGQAESLFRTEFGNLYQIFDELRAKYIDLIVRSRAPAKAFLANPISPPLNSFHRSVTNLAGYPDNADLRDIIGSTADVGTLADSFATAEFLITRGLAQSISIPVDGPGGLSIHRAAIAAGCTTASPEVTSFYVITDAHATGTAIMIPAYTFKVVALMACINELIRSMGASRFNETVIRVGSEFSRIGTVGKNANTGEIESWGSEHGWQGHAFMLMSGAIKKPYVLGNILTGVPFNTSAQLYNSGTYCGNPVQNPVAQFPGTAGTGTTNTHEGSTQTILNYGHMGSTICAALNVPSPTPNFRSLISINTQGEIVPIIDKGQNRS